MIEEIPRSWAYSGEPLPRRPRPHSDESLSGYLLRVAETNGYSSVSWLFDMADLPMRALTSPMNLGSLARRLDADLADLQRRTYWPPPGRTKAYSQFFGHAVRKFQLLRQTARVCPDCLKQSAYCRNTWDIRLAVACHYHSKLMVESCPNCSRRLTWRRKKVCNCGYCGFDLRDHSVGAAPEPVLALMKRLHRAINRERYGEASADPLDALSLMELLDLVQLTGSYAMGLRNKGAALGLARRSPQHIAVLLEAAANVLEDWPSGFFALLDEIGENTAALTEGRHTGLYKEFGDLYSTLIRRFPRRHFLRRTFTDYIADVWCGGYITNRHKWLDLPKTRTYLTRPEAAAELEISPQTVDVLLRNGELSGEIRPWGLSRSLAVITRQSVTAYKARRRHVIESEAAAQRLGVSRHVYRDLVTAGILKANRGHTSMRPRKAFEIDVRQIDRLLGSLERRVQSGQRGAAIGYVSAVIRFGQTGRRNTDLIKAVLRNKLAPVAIDERAVGLRRFRFSDDAVSAFLGAGPRRRQVQEPVAAQLIIIDPPN